MYPVETPSLRFVVILNPMTQSQGRKEETMNEDESNNFDSDACDGLSYEGDCCYIPLVF